MAKKARRKKRPPKKDVVDWGTPQTRAKQYIPFWRSLEPELQEASMAIYEALFLELGELLCDGARLEHLPRSASPGWSKAQYKMVRAYHQWLGEMERQGWDHKPVIRHCFFDEPCQDEGNFVQAMMLYCELAGTLPAPLQKAA